LPPEDPPAPVVDALVVATLVAVVDVAPELVVASELDDPLPPPAPVEVDAGACIALP
jgi:hypothetical protein